MSDGGHDWKPEQARKSLSRLLPELEVAFAMQLEPLAFDWHRFKNRLHREWERLFSYLHDLYGWQYDFHYTLETVACLGACALAPVMVVNKTVYGRMNPKRIENVLDMYAK